MYGYVGMDGRGEIKVVFDDGYMCFMYGVATERYGTMARQYMRLSIFTMVYDERWRGLC